jgi:hypothetical protein
MRDESGDKRVFAGFTVGGSPLRPAPDNRSRFFAFFAMLPAKLRPLRLAIPVKTPNPAAISRKRDTKTPILRSQRNPLGTPPLWPHLAEIARLAKTAFLP